MSSRHLWICCVLLACTIAPFAWSVEIGDVAPQFVVTKATDGKEAKRSDFYGQSNVLLNVLNRVDSPVNTEFVKQLQSKTEMFTTRYDATVITVISQPLKDLASFKTQSNLELELYSDSTSSIASGYGATGGATFYLIDKSGHVRWRFDAKSADDRPTMEVLESALSKLKRNTPLSVGSPAPDFSLTEADGETIFTLSDQRQKKNVLVTILLQTY